MTTTNYNLFLDDTRFPWDVTWVNLPKQVAWTVVRDFREFVRTIDELGIPTFVTFDHDLCWEHMRDYFKVCEIEDQILNPLKFEYDKYSELTGYHCAIYMKKKCAELGIGIPPFQVHSKNHIGVRNIRTVLQSQTKGILP